MYTRLFVHEDVVDLLCEVVELQQNLQDLRQCEGSLYALQQRFQNMEQQFSAVNRMASETLQLLRQGTGLESEAIALTARLSRVRAVLCATKERVNIAQVVEEVGPTVEQLAAAAWRGVLRKRNRDRKNRVRGRMVLGEVSRQGYVEFESETETEGEVVACGFDSQEEESCSDEDEDEDGDEYDDEEAW